MRLTENEIAAIREAVHLLDEEAGIYLFGSRADDQQRGGDIDLLIMSGKLSVRDRRLIRRRLHERLGEQKIDIIIAGDLSDPFVRVAHREGIAL